MMTQHAPHFQKPEAVIYCRVAQATLADIADALARQERACRIYAQSKSLRVIETFTDHASGSTVERPGLQAMLAYLHSRKDSGLTVIVEDYARLGRDLSVLQDLTSQIRAVGNLRDVQNDGRVPTFKWAFQ